MNIDTYLPQLPLWIGPGHSCCPQGWWECFQPGEHGVTWYGAQRQIRRWSGRWRSTQWHKHSQLSGSHPESHPADRQTRIFTMAVCHWHCAMIYLYIFNLAHRVLCCLIMIHFGYIQKHTKKMFCVLHLLSSNTKAFWPASPWCSVNYTASQLIFI